MQKIWTILQFDGANRLGLRLTRITCARALLGLAGDDRTAAAAAPQMDVNLKSAALAAHTAALCLAPGGECIIVRAENMDSPPICCG